MDEHRQHEEVADPIGVTLTGDGIDSAALAALPAHPVGTFAFVGAYAVMFVVLWFAIYYFIFLARQPVTP